MDRSRGRRGGEMWLGVVGFLVIGCAGDKAPPAAPAAPASHSVEAPEPQPVEAPEPEPVKTAAELYDECRVRVEGPQEAGECTSHADCARAGCSREVCLPKARAMEIMTTCDAKPCFAVLDVCACNDGQCTWSLKEQVPAQLPKPEDLPQ